jgi:hypothetical protein
MLSSRSRASASTMPLSYSDSQVGEFRTIDDYRQYRLRNTECKFCLS